MNEKEAQNQPEKGLDETRKAALLRYLGIMFLVAFVFVLLSLAGQLRNSEDTISQLNQSSSSAMEKAEQLQDHNRQLETDNAYLEGRIEELEKQLADLEQELTESEEQAQEQTETISNLEQQLQEAKAFSAQLQSEYDKLLQAQEQETAE